MKNTNLRLLLLMIGAITQFALLSFSASAQVKVSSTQQTITSEQNESPFVKRAIITSNIENREPIDNLNQQIIANRYDKLFFFTEIVNKADQSVSHRWFLNGRLEAEVKLSIGGNRWRTYSSKSLIPIQHVGNWQVEVVDEKGRLLVSREFSIVEE